MTETSRLLRVSARLLPQLGRLGLNLDAAAKRALDIVIALGALIALAPVFGLIALAIKRDSPGPVLFRGRRIGRKGKPFFILKFRTMYERPSSYRGPRITGQNDPRITSVGAWLRDSKLNELPQVWNVLVGEMSLVGPRPEDPEIVETWPEDLQEEILSVRPGITSPASVQYHNEEDLLPAANVMKFYLESILPSKLRLDQLYVRHRSFWLDLDVIIWTVLIVFLDLGAYSPPEELLLLGPVNRLMRLHLSWFAIDALTTFFAIGVTGAYFRSFGPLHVGWPISIASAVLFALLFSVIGAIFGVHRIVWSQASAGDALDLIPVVVLSALLSGLANHIQPGGPLFPPGLIWMASVLSLFGFVTVRYRWRLLRMVAQKWIRWSKWVRTSRERVLIVGCDVTAQFVSWILHNHDNARSFQVVGFVDEDLYKQGNRVYGAPVLGRYMDIPRLVSELRVGIVILTTQDGESEDDPAVIEACKSSGARIVLFPDVMGMLNTMAGPGRTEGAPGGSIRFEPTGYAWPGIAPERVQAWLDDLAVHLQKEDLQGLARKVQAMRASLKTQDAPPRPMIVLRLKPESGE